MLDRFADERELSCDAPVWLVRALAELDGPRAAARLEALVEHPSVVVQIEAEHAMLEREK
jgi:hypothetical protein